MSYADFNNFLEKHGTSRTGVEGGEIALTKQDALNAIELLSGTFAVILGGDVYELESDGYFQPTYDNWYFNKGDVVSLDMAEKSRNKAIEFLNNYKEDEDINIRYVLVVDNL